MAEKDKTKKKLDKPEEKATTGKTKSDGKKDKKDKDKKDKKDKK